MGYRRGTIFGVLVALISAIVPAILILLVAWHLHVQDRQERLDGIAELLLQREEQSMRQATDALMQLAKTQLQPCSPEHIQLMRHLTVEAAPLDEIAYVGDDEIQCSSWGDIQGEVPPQTADFTTPEGLSVFTGIRPVISGAGPALALRYGAYSALISLQHFVDVIVEPNIQLGLAIKGGDVVVRTDAENANALMQVLWSSGKETTPGYLTAIHTQGGWLSVAISRGGGLWQYLKEEYDDVLPGVALVGLVIFLLVLPPSLKRLSPLAELRAAIRRKEFEVHYQPIVDVRSGACIGAEALLRWPRGHNQWIRPDVFIPIAEESGLIRPITDQLVRMVVEEMHAMLAANPAMHISLNLYSDDIRTGRVLTVLEKELTARGVSPRQIWLEVTERGFMDIHSARMTLEQARKRGYQVAIDDFGTGYSSLQYLQGLPLDILKIDKSFVAPIGKGAVSSQVIYHIIEMGKSLNLTLVAEGVETREQADYLAGLGVFQIQGWFYAKAMPAEEFLAYCQAHPCPPAARHGRAA